MPNNDYANAGDQSRAERILSSIINGTEYDEPVQSRLEYLLLQLLATLDAKADLDENGLIPVTEIPPEAFEYMIDVEDDTARFALTTDDVQKGDIVRVISTGIMYIVVDVAHLSTEAGYKPFAAGIAAKAIGDEDGNNIKSTYQTKVIGSWTAGSETTHSTPVATDTVLEVMEKIDNNQRLDEAKTSSMGPAGTGYIVVNGIQFYISSTAPTGNIPDGSVGVGW